MTLHLVVVRASGRSCNNNLAPRKEVAMAVVDGVIVARHVVIVIHRRDRIVEISFVILYDMVCAPTEMQCAVLFLGQFERFELTRIEEV
jgi:hypothetical protein